MNIDDLHILLYQPNSVQEGDSVQLKQILKDYPYFQSVRSLYLKSLYTANNHKYNNELKKTAIYTLDRDVLFEFIVSKEFVPYKAFEISLANKEILPGVASETKEESKEKTLEDNLKERIAKIVYTIEDTEEVENKLPVEELIVEEIPTESLTIENVEPDVTEEVEDEKEAENTTEVQVLEERLQIGEPLNFAANDKFSFNEWLQLAQKRPIERDENPIKTEKESVEVIKDTILTEDNNINKTEQEKNLALIDKFIQTNPKIVPTKKLSSPPVNIEVSVKENDSLMTETLAKIYLEQKKYQKAIQAYEILILKYPEKSSFFADQIVDIKALQQYNS